MSTSTVPQPLGKLGWINALISLGAGLGGAYLGNPMIAQVVNLAATTTEGLISQISAAKTSAGATGKSTAGELAVPIFVSVLKATLAAALAEGKIDVKSAKVLSDSLTAMGTEDLIAQAIVDYTTIGPIDTV